MMGPKHVEAWQRNKVKEILHRFGLLYKYKFNLTFGWSFIILYQYSENNVMLFLFSLSKIKGLYMFRELLAHPQ
jgi:hypothetical protein